MTRYLRENWALLIHFFFFITLGTRHLKPIFQNLSLFVSKFQGLEPGTDFQKQCHKK